MNYQLYISIAVIVAILIFLVILSLTYLYFYFRVFSGIILFKIDNLNKRVLRISKRNYLLSTIFDMKAVNFNKFNYVPLSEFLEFFALEDRKFLENYLTNNNTEKKYKNFNINIAQTKKFNLFENCLFFIYRLTKADVKYSIKITPDENGIYECAINWSKSNRLVDKKITLLATSKKVEQNYEKLIKKWSHKNNIVVSFMLRPTYFNKKFDTGELQELYTWMSRYFKISLDKIDIYQYNGFHFFIIKQNKKTNRKINNIVNRFNQNSQLYPYYEIAIFFNNEPIDSETMCFNLLNKLEFGVYNAYYAQINKADNNPYINFDFKNKLDEFEKFRSWFVLHTNIFALYNTADIIMNKYEIKDYSSQKHYNNYLVDFIAKNSKLNDLFKQVPYLKYTYEPIIYKQWNNSILEHPQREFNPKYFFKLSQESFLNEQNQLNIQKESPIILVYTDNFFKHKQLKEKFLHYHEAHIHLGLYINKINNNILNFVSDAKFTSLVIGKEIAQNLYKTDVLYDCINLIKNATENKKLRIIFENIPNSLDELVIDKLKIQYYYQS
ncbi:MHO_4530 family protein [Mycoplasma nasistruthionis]|uniref:Uncharacterized protein n=1 Tax=Mycoplasma nasistruthionis TaxID=353852 RepID=A0A5B7XUR5_9MOLU|nr:hypothetical protein [Mycoplasma nasistruthionis]QCZ36616.1 hypothetical protein FG904_01105 [Mycoplasma nasistruthionis]